jgi:Xaa-Pro aminopeptidase
VITEPVITARRARVVDAMTAAGIDALILGKEANARYVSGARRLWLAGARPFAPGCVFVGASADVYVLSTSNDGIPDDIPVEHLYPITWNPANLLARLAAIPGLRDARRIGVDGMTPMLDRFLTTTFPDAEFVDGHALMLAARREKVPGEIEAIRQAIAIAGGALDDTVAVMRPGTRERDLLAHFEQRMCELGTTTPAFEGTFGRSVFATDRAIEAGERVVLDAGVLVDGYEGGLARTVVCGDGAQGPTAADDLAASLLAVVRPGANGDDLWAVWDASGVSRPTQPVAMGTGIGVEPPIIGDDPMRFVPGMVITVRAEASGWIRRDTVLVTESGYERLDNPVT